MRCYRYSLILSSREAWFIAKPYAVVRFMAEEASKKLATKVIEPVHLKAIE
jgi:hypothetical protein